MINAITGKTIKQFWSKHDTNIVLFIMLLIFMSYALFIALNLKTGIIPDEITHYIFSKHFSTTIGIPPDTPETYARGVYVEHNPFIYYWINGRLINLIDIFWPSLTDWQMLVSLRIVNLIYTTLTIIICYLISKELIKNKWWQLLPVFLLTNTIMFVFLAGGVNYDNLTNLLCISSLFFLTRALKHHGFFINSLYCMICISFGALTKYTALPLGLVIGIVWIAFLIKDKPKIILNNFNDKKVAFSVFVLFILLIGNLSIYGHNIIIYQAIRPPCDAQECSISPQRIMFNIYGLDEKLSISESIHLGYPGPIKYIFTDWTLFMFNRIFGIWAHEIYFSAIATITHLILFFWITLLTIKYWRDFSYLNAGLLIIFFSYSLILALFNYNVELKYGFKHNIALQGRYIFPVIGIAYTFMAKVLLSVPQKYIQIPSLLITLLLYFISGPLTFIYRYNALFSEWFVR